MCASVKRRRNVQSSDAIGIVVLALLVVLVRLLFSPAPIVLPPPSELVAPSEPEKVYTAPSRPSAPAGELFAFDPNTLDSAGFLRLGFSSAQTQSLLKYRASGAVFRQPEDFGRSYVVSDQMYERLKPYIRIKKIEQVVPLEPLQEEAPKVAIEPKNLLIEINRADTSQLKKLRGIGSYYAQKIVQYRERLGGFVLIEQLLEIEGIDEERLLLFGAQVEIDDGRVRKIDIRTADQNTLGKHPYIGPYAARWIVHYREQLGDSICTLPSLLRRNIIKPKQAEMLAYYVGDAY